MNVRFTMSAALFLGGVLLGVLGGNLFQLADVTAESLGVTGDNSAAVGSGGEDQREHSGVESSNDLQTRVDFYQQLSAERLQEEFQQLRRGDFSFQVSELSLLFSVWSEVDPIAALEAAKQLKFSKDEMIGLVLGKWTAFNPIEAAKYYKSNESQLFTRNYAEPWNQVSSSEIVARALATASPEEGLKWARGLGSVEDQNRAVAGLFGALIGDDSEQALQFFENLPPGGTRDAALLAIADSWVKKDLDGAIELVNTLGHQDQPRALPRLVSGMAESDPETATQYLKFLTGNTDQVVGKIVHSWASSDPKGTAQWLVSDLPVEQHRFFFQPLFERWIPTGKDQVKEWIESQPDGPSKEEAVVSYVKATASGREAPQSLIKLANNAIQSRERRDRALTEVFVAWSRVDYEAARESAESSAISDRAISDFLHRANAQTPLD